MTKSNNCTEECVRSLGGLNKSNLISYALGYKFCRECGKYFKTDGWKCGCCGRGLRCKPANGKKRELLVEAMRV